MWYFWRGWQQCTTMDKTWSRKQPTRRQPRHPPLCPGRSCRCGLARLQVCWDPPVMGTSLPQTRARKVGGISVFEGLYQHHTLQTVVLIASYSISDGVCFVLYWKYILSWRTHIMYNLPDVYEQQMSPSYHWRVPTTEKSPFFHTLASCRNDMLKHTLQETFPLLQWPQIRPQSLAEVIDKTVCCVLAL